MNVSIERTVIVEDAVSGVQAGKKGNFAMVVGLARENNFEELATNGADVVFSDIAELGGIKGIEDWLKSNKN